MTRVRFLTAFVVGAIACAPPTTPEAPAPQADSSPRAHPFDALERDIRERIGREPGAEVGVSVVDLATGLRLGIDERVSMHAASTMKVPILLELFRQADQGGPALDRAVRLANEFRSIVGDTAYTLTAGDDSDSTLYQRLGETATALDLAGLMITRSSNLATNLLITHVQPDAINRTLARIGAEGMRVLRGVEDGPAYRRGLNNTTTAQGFARVLEAIARCSVTTASACDRMVTILAAQEFNEMIPAGLPAGTRVAHKTGWITGIRHDGGIVYPPDRPPYVLVVLTRGIADHDRADRLGADISRMVWETLTDARTLTLAWSADAETRALAELQRTNRVEAILDRHFTHETLWHALSPHLGRAIAREEVGRSGQGRPLYLLRFGNGPTRVLLWSQMHGDESTATMALADLIRFVDSHPDDARVRRWAGNLTLLMVPMINPDGAERFVRQNAVGIDVNRDARALATPEGRTLKTVRDRYEPQFGFNLHDQNPRTRVGRSDRLAAISLLAPVPNATDAMTPAWVRATRVAAVIRAAIEPLVGGHIAKYDDSFNARAFGDLMQQWGTSTVLIESGGWRHDPEKQFLRTVNFVAITSALDAIASGGYAAADPAVYASLAQNGGSVNDLLIRGGTLVVAGVPPVRADVAVNFEDEGGDPALASITEIGDLAELDARDTLDASGLFVHATADEARGADSQPGFLLPRMRASFVVRRTAEPDSEPVYVVDVAGARRAGRDE
jgi:beta-lactamase class A